MISLIQISFLKSILREKYPYKYSFLIEIFSMIISLSVIWFTSLAFKPVSLIQENVESYFSFLVTAEIALYSPLMLFESNIKIGKRLLLNGIFEKLHASNTSLLRVFFLFSKHNFLLSLLRFFLTYFVCSFLFTLPFEIKSLPFLFLANLIFSFIFCLLGSAVGLVVLFWGRGEGIFHKLISLLSVLGGSYFPLKVLPFNLEGFLKALNPIGHYLEVFRNLAKQPSWPSFEITFLWIIASFILYYMSLKLGLKRVKSQGLPTLYAI